MPKALFSRLPTRRHSQAERKMSLRQKNDIGPNPDSDCDDINWAERSDFWNKYTPTRGKGRPKKFHYRLPLTLCGHGVRIRVDHNTLLIRAGYTHYPQKPEENRYFPG